MKKNVYQALGERERETGTGTGTGTDEPKSVPRTNIKHLKVD